VRIFDLEQLKVLFPVGPLLLEWRGAKANFDPGANSVRIDTCILHVVEVFIASHRSPSESPRFNRLKGGFSRPGFTFAFTK